MPDFAFDELKKRGIQNPDPKVIMNHSERHNFVVSVAPTIMTVMITSERYQNEPLGVKARLSAQAASWLFDEILKLREPDEAL